MSGILTFGDLVFDHMVEWPSLFRAIVRLLDCYGITACNLKMRPGVHLGGARPDLRFLPLPSNTICPVPA